MVNKDFEVLDGFKCYAPALAKVNNGFSSESFNLLYELETNNFWFRSRNELICFLVEKYVQGQNAEVCEIGCGTGYVLKGLSLLPNLKLSGSEIYVEGLKFAKLRLPDVELFQADATNLPFYEKYDAIGAFDVLEHIENDTKAMASIHRSLKKDGLFFISVPQYQWMWSWEDDIAFHKRRYSKRELLSKLNRTGFEVAYIGSFVCMLFPAMAMQRLTGRSAPENSDTINKATSGLQLPTVVNIVFHMIMKIDLFLIRMGISLPWGGSLIAVAKKE